MKFLVDWISLQVGELLGYGACSLFITWSTVIFGRAIFCKAIFCKAIYSKAIYGKVIYGKTISGRAIYTVDG